MFKIANHHHPPFPLDQRVSIQLFHPSQRFHYISSFFPNFRNSCTVLSHVFLAHSILLAPAGSNQWLLSIRLFDFLRECSIHPHFLLCICNAIGSWFVILQRASFETISSHLILTIHPSFPSLYL